MDYISNKVGSGLHTSILSDPWVGSIPLKHILPRSFTINNYHEGSVVEVGEMGR